MTSIKDTIENIAAAAADGKVTLTISGPDTARGSYVVTSADRESWSGGTLYRVQIKSVITLDDGGLTSADVWVQIAGGDHISKIIMRTSASDGRDLAFATQSNRQLRGCMLRIGDHVIASGGYMNMRHMKNLIVEA